MASTISPTCPEAGDTVTITGASSSQEAAAVFVLRLTSAPDESDLTAGFLVQDLDASYVSSSEAQTAADGTVFAPELPLSARQIAALDIGSAELVVDVPGVYALQMWEFRKVTDAAGVERVDFIAQTSETIDVCQLVDMVLAAPQGHGVTLRLAVDSSTVVAASLVNPRSETARLALDEATVAAELARLVGLTTRELGENLIARVVELATRWNLHMADATNHTSADTDNPILRTVPGSIEASIEVLNQLRQVMISHIKEIGISAIHVAPDMTSYPLARPAQSLAQAVALEADLTRVYAEHRQLGDSSTPAIHAATGGDRANGLRKSIDAAILEDDGAFIDYTSEANDATVGDVLLLPITTGAGWQITDAFYFGASVMFGEVEVRISTAGAGTHAVTWEYWDGAAWSSLGGVQDDTAAFTAAVGDRVASWGEPTDWEPTTVNSQGPFYFVRARITTADATPTTRPEGTTIWPRLAPAFLSRVLIAYTAEVSKQDPTVSSGELQGAADAAQRYGFRRND